ncbi:PREDICTED: atherin-like [Gekko japonicus]|uniref:Atherin-like n=1 Tax=Gekko japonicus TaxID=146911 RepID=A0ABM1KN11_GEKJA|nr:PREDICTED: atherin-like [Gekko japonicus]
MAGPPPPPPGQEAPRYQEWILDTIDSLRSRKARPDLERICRMVRRRHGPEPERTRAELEKLIQQRAVLRVSYKGSISYRNAARVQPPRRGGAPAASPAAPQRPKAGEEAKGEEEEEEEEEEEDEVSTMSEGSEVAQEYEASNYSRSGVGQVNGDCKDSKHGGKEIPPSSALPRDLHSLEEHSLNKGSEHPHHEGSERCHTKASWPGESACQHLGGSKKDGSTYQQPDRAVSPAVAGSEPSVPSSPGRPGIHADGRPFSCISAKEKPSDPVEWTVSDVVDYFTEAGFAEQASAFQEQEIDGKSLLLMQRTDVLTGLSIRLGPALKIYEYHIKVLQQCHFEEDEGDSFMG